MLSILLRHLTIEFPKSPGRSSSHRGDVQDVADPLVERVDFLDAELDLGLALDELLLEVGDLLVGDPHLAGQLGHHLLLIGHPARRFRILQLAVSRLVLRLRQLQLLSDARANEDSKSLV